MCRVAGITAGYVIAGHKYGVDDHNFIPKIPHHSCSNIISRYSGIIKNHTYILLLQ